MHIRNIQIFWEGAHTLPRQHPIKFHDDDNDDDADGDVYAVFRSPYVSSLRIRLVSSDFTSPHLNSSTGLTSFQLVLIGHNH